MFNLARENIFWSSIRATPYAYFIYGLFNLLNNTSYTNIYYLSAYIFVFISNGIFKHTSKFIYNTLDTDYIFPIGQGSRPTNCTNSGTFLLVSNPESKSYGMPSGHSQLAWFFSTYIILDILLDSKELTDDTIRNINIDTSKSIRILLLIILALTVGYSRVYIDGCHTLGQVSVGGIIGIVFAFLAYYLKFYIKSKIVN